MMSLDAAPASLPARDPAAATLRPVHRAIAELRRGTPVIIDPAVASVAPGGDDARPFILWAAETVGAAGLAEAAPLCATPPVLLLAPTRAAALLRRPVDPSAAASAFRTNGLLDGATLRGIADPTADQLLAEPPEPAPVPARADVALALLKLARLLPAALVAPLRIPSTIQHDLVRVSAADILAYPDASAAALHRVAEAHVPLAAARDARIIAFRTADAAVEHVAIQIGDPAAIPATAQAALVRVHSECFTGDLLGSLRCDCGPQLAAALERIGREGTGLILYLAQEGRGIGLPSKLRAYTLQDRGLDTVDANRALGFHADERSFLVAATMLEQLGIHRIRLLTNNPDKVAALTACGIDVTAREPLQIAPNGTNDHYLQTKAHRLGHDLPTGL